MTYSLEPFEYHVGVCYQGHAGAVALTLNSLQVQQAR